MKFKIGDKVRRLCNVHMGMKKGDIGTIISIGIGSIRLEEFGGSHSMDKFEIAKTTMKDILDL